jgi:hypothetical protein
VLLVLLVVVKVTVLEVVGGTVYVGAGSRMQVHVFGSQKKPGIDALQSKSVQN